MTRAAVAGDDAATKPLPLLSAVSDVDDDDDDDDAAGAEAPVLGSGPEPLVAGGATGPISSR